MGPHSANMDKHQESNYNDVKINYVLSITDNDKQGFKANTYRELASSVRSVCFLHSFLLIYVLHLCGFLICAWVLAMDFLEWDYLYMKLSRVGSSQDL